MISALEGFAGPNTEVDRFLYAGPIGRPTDRPLAVSLGVPIQLNDFLGFFGASLRFGPVVNRSGECQGVINNRAPIGVYVPSNKVATAPRYDPSICVSLEAAISDLERRISIIGITELFSQPGNLFLASILASTRDQRTERSAEDYRWPFC